jgi:hypothetical protein
MNLETLFTGSRSLIIPLILIALTIILGVYGIYLSMRIGRKKS